jgi:Tol biopolymer transport system component
MSDDGRYVVFHSWATNLVASDTNGQPDVFLRDVQNGTTERVSLTNDGAEANYWSTEGWISGNGRYVAFTSSGSNMVAGDGNNRSDVFVRDLLLGTTTLVSATSGGTSGNEASDKPAITSDGRYVVFLSAASDLVAGDTNGVADVFVRDRMLGTTERVNVSSTGAQSAMHSTNPTISDDGRYVAFNSFAYDLVVGGTNGYFDLFVRDRLLGTTIQASVSVSGVQGNANTDNLSAMAPNGSFVAFPSDAWNLVIPDTNGSSRDILLRWLQ